MNHPILIAIIAGVPGVLAAILGLVNRKGISDIHVMINSNLKKMLKLAEAAGRLNEKNDVQDRANRKEKM
jgi:hypothetical protein